MSPQPLARVKPDARLCIGPLMPAGDFDPELCRLAIHVVSLWSYTEATLLRMVSSFLDAEHVVVTNMLQALKSAEGRRAAIKAAAEYRLADSPKDRRFFFAALKALTHAEGLRNRYAHHIWASSPDVPGAIMLIDPKLVERAVAAEAAGATERGWQTPGAPHFDRMDVLVYRKQDVMQDVSESVDAAMIIDRVEEWYSFVAGDARGLSDPIEQMLLEQYPRLRKAYEQEAE